MVYLQHRHSWCYMKLLPSWHVLCTPYNHALGHFMWSHNRKVRACLGEGVAVCSKQVDKQPLWIGFEWCFWVLCFSVPYAITCLQTASPCNSVKYFVFPMVCAACMHAVCILLWMAHVLSCYCACSPLTSLLFYCYCMKSACIFLMYFLYIYCVCVCVCVCVWDCVCVLLYVFPMQHSFMYYS